MANTIDEQIGGRVRKLRERKGVSIEDAAFACELDVPEYEASEAGLRTLTTYELLRLCVLLDAAMVEIFADLRL